MNTQNTPARTYQRRTSTPPNTTPTPPEQTTRHTTPAVPPPRNPLTSNNTHPRAGATGRMASGRRAACVVPGAVPASRLLLVASTGWPLASAAVSELVRWRVQLGYAGGTLIVGEGSVESSCARYWEQSRDSVERVSDVVGAVDGADVVLAFVVDLDPAVLAVIERAGAVGVPVVPNVVGPYPYPVGSEQARVAARGRAASGRA